MPTLEWLGKDEAKQTAKKVPYRVLEAADRHGEESENLLIQGDNLEALKALLPYYAGRVKCIYIDPPYNTRSAFEHYDDNLEHATWLSLIYPRLELLRELLSEEGSIWVSIDDNEAHYLKTVMDEVFGRKNFVANVVWQKKFSPQNDAKWISNSHDHILCYATNKSSWFPRQLPRTADMDNRYKNPDNDPRGVWASTDLTRAEHRDRDFWGLVTPSGKVVFPAKGRSWSRPKENIEKLANEGRLWFGPSGDKMPRLKKYINEMDGGLTPQTLWFHGDVGNNQEAKRETVSLNFDVIFDTPKPERLIQRILQLATHEGDLVLDSFLGSGTTAAVAHKMKRRWIGIEMGDHALTHCVPRLKKVIEGEQGGISQSVGWQGGGGFSFLRLGETIFDERGHTRQGIRFKTLAAHVWFSETKQPFLGGGDSPLLGVFNGTAYYLLYNGILGDRRPDSGNVLTSHVLEGLPPFDGPKVVYCERSAFGARRLMQEKITFKQTPYDIRHQ